MTSSPAPSPAAPHTVNPWLVLVTVASGLFLVIIDQTILNLALPNLAQSLDASLSELEWTIIAYTITLTVLVPVFGRISDVLGRKRLFIAGVILFTAASLAAGLSPTILWLIIFRIVQGCGGALITANVLAIITDVFPPGKRGAAMGIQAIIISAGGAFGPTVGGILITHLSWRAVFFVNVPIGILSAVVAVRVLPSLKSQRRMEPVDWRGALLLVAGLGAVLFGVTKGPEWGWSSPAVLGLSGAGIAVTAAFFLWESRTRFPLIDLALLRIPAFTTGQLAGFLALVSLAALNILIPFYWQSLRGFSAQKAGLLLLPVPITIAAISPFAGRLSDRFGPRGIATAGLLFVVLSLFLTSFLSATTPIPLVMAALALFGVGMALFTTPNNNGVMSSVPPERRGVAAGLLGMGRHAGQSIGIAFVATIFAIFAASGGFAIHGLPSPADRAAAIADPATASLYNDAFLRGFRIAMLLAIPLAALAAILSAIRGGAPRPATGSPPPAPPPQPAPATDPP